MNDSFQTLIAALAQGDLAAQTVAARQMAQAATTPAEATIELVRALDRPFDEGLFPWLESALENIECPPAAQAAQLSEMIERFHAGSAHSDAAYWAVTMLGRMGPDAAGAVPVLAVLLDRTDQPNLQFKAAWALRKIGPLAKSAEPYLIRAAARVSHPRLAILAREAIEEINR